MTVEQQSAIAQCRLVLLTGWTWEYVDRLPIEIIGQLLSYDDATTIIRNMEMNR